MLHLKNTTYLPEHCSDLLKKSRFLSSKLFVKIMDCRVSTNMIEFDVFCDKHNLEEFIISLSPIGKLNDATQVIDRILSNNHAIEEGKRFFNEQRFWESHETLESVWKTTTGNERSLVQGIILVAAAFVHLQKNQKSICLSIFQRALKKLDVSISEYHGIDIENLKTKLTNFCNNSFVTTFKI